MKKLSLVIIIIIALSLFAAADYYLNNLSPKAQLDLIGKEIPDEKPPINSLFKLDEELGDYKVVNQVQTSQIFEKIDLSNIKNIKIYRNQLERVEADSEPIFLYEIQGPKNQGSITYLNVKLQFIAQINATTETLNETGEFGHNNFFFNDLNYENMAFIFMQIGDNLFGFQYSKLDPQTYEGIKTIIQTLMTEDQSNNITP